jgi:hypothetical protein
LTPEMALNRGESSDPAGGGTNDDGCMIPLLGFCSLSGNLP